jgi:hypothetical protein
MEITTDQVVRRSFPFIIQHHPVEYTGYPFLSVIQYKNQHIISIIDNVNKKTVKAFVLDLCGPENVDEELVINIASYWYEFERNRYPLSIEFSKRNLAGITAKIMKTYSIDSIARIMGPLYVYPTDNVIKIKRRKRREISNAVEVKRLAVVK